MKGKEGSIPFYSIAPSIVRISKTYRRFIKADPLAIPVIPYNFLSFLPHEERSLVKWKTHYLFFYLL